MGIKIKIYDQEAERLTAIILPFYTFIFGLLTLRLTSVLAGGCKSP